MPHHAAPAASASPAVHVEEIDRLSGFHLFVRNRSLDSPTLHSSHDSLTLQFTGWASGDKPYTSIGLYDIQGIELHRAPVDIPRPDVVAKRRNIPLACGFSFPFTCVGPPLTTYQLIAFTADGEAKTLYRITLRIAPLPVAPLSIAPLMLTSLGRSGSTWVMGLLARHPDIIAHDPHRFDSRIASYWAHVFATLSHPRSHRQSLIPQELGNDLWWVSGPLPPDAVMPDPPVARFVEHDTVIATADFCLRRIDAFYHHLAATLNRPIPPLFIEKFDPRLARITLRNLCPNAREIVLLRDPRDTLCSVLAFNKKRGYASFGREAVGSDEDYIRWYAGPLSLLRYTLDTPSRPVTVLRYEDLIRQPRETLRSLLTALSLDASEATTANLLAHPDSDILDLHRTTASPGASVARWKTDLPQSLRAAVRTHLDPLLLALGYEPTA
jgi:hypothetical protein